MGRLALRQNQSGLMPRPEPTTYVGISNQRDQLRVESNNSALTAQDLENKAKELDVRLRSYTLEKLKLELIEVTEQRDELKIDLKESETRISAGKRISMALGMATAGILATGLSLLRGQDPVLLTFGLAMISAAPIHYVLNRFLDRRNSMKNQNNGDSSASNPPGYSQERYV